MKGLNITEAEFMGQVIQLAHLEGWIIAHFRPMRKANGGWETPCQADAKGFPDLFMLRPNLRQRVAIELKVGKNKLSPEQDRWLDAMEVSGIPAYVWTPKDWAEIESVLKHGPVLDHRGIRESDKKSIASRVVELCEDEFFNPDEMSPEWVELYRDAKELLTSTAGVG